MTSDQQFVSKNTFLLVTSDQKSVCKNAFLFLLRAQKLSIRTSFLARAQQTVYLNAFLQLHFLLQCWNCQCVFQDTTLCLSKTHFWYVEFNSFSIRMSFRSCLRPNKFVCKKAFSCSAKTLFCCYVGIASMSFRAKHSVCQNTFCNVEFNSFC